MVRVQGTIASEPTVAPEIPEGVVAMFEITGIGPKTGARFRKELGLTSVEALEEAAESGRSRALNGFGAKSK